MPFSIISVATSASAKSPRPDAFHKSGAACRRVRGRHSARDRHHLGGRLGAGGDAGGAGGVGRARGLRLRSQPGHRGAGAHRLACGRRDSAAGLLGERLRALPGRYLAYARTGDRDGTPRTDRPAADKRFDHAVRLRRLHCRAGRRGRRVAVQAGSGPQGFFDTHSRSRRGARSTRLAVLRDPYGGRIVSHVRDDMSVGVAILGSTGSIGRSTLQVLARQRERFRVVALTAHSNRDLLAEQERDWRPAFVGLVNGGGTGDGGQGKGSSCLVEAATHPDVKIVVNGIVGAAGLEATLAALRAGKRVALAHKETLVMAGELVAQAAREGGGEIVPVDSEHSAVLQCVSGRRPAELARLILTASGGPFRTWGADRVSRATVAGALKPPTWQVGKKIRVDSATR